MNGKEEAEGDGALRTFAKCVRLGAREKGEMERNGRREAMEEVVVVESKEEVRNLGI